MRIPKQDVPVRFALPGAIVRQHTDFGTASGVLGAEYLSLAAGTDISPLLEGLDGDLCHSPHWGYVIDGSAVVTYADGRTETCAADELFHWPAGHTVRIEEDAELVLFSPQVEHGQVFDHMVASVAAANAR